VGHGACELLLVLVLRDITHAASEEIRWSGLSTEAWDCRQAGKKVNQQPAWLINTP
jgi:hypothetical protein